MPRTRRQPAALRSAARGVPLLAAMILGGVGAQAQAPGGPVQVRLPVEVEGSRPDGQVEIDGLVDDGNAVPSARLAAVPAAEHRLALYIDRQANRPAVVRAVANELGQRLDEIAALGAVDIVLADVERRSVVRRSRSAEEVRRALDQISIARGDEDAVADLRREFLATRRAGDESSRLALDAMEIEVAHRRERLDLLLDWMAAAGQPEAELRVLLLLAEDFATTPRSFYSRFVADDELASLHAMPLPSLDEVRQAAAAYGWILLPVALEDEARGRLRYEPTPDLPVGFRLGLGGRGDDRPEAEEDLGLEIEDPGALARLAEESGGDLLRGLDDLAGFAGRLERYQLLRYEVSAAPIGELRSVSRPRGASPRLRLPAWTISGTPESISGLRARRALDGAASEGELLMRSTIALPERGGQTTPASGEAEAPYQVRIDLTPLEERNALPQRASFRITFAVHLATGEVLLRHEHVADAALADRAEWSHEGSLRLPAETDAAVAVVELLDSGDWGESFASFVSRPAAATADAGTTRPRLPDGVAAVRLAPLPGEAVTGRVRFSAAAAEVVDRVEFLLDGERIANRRRPPYDARADLGPTARQHMLVAIAYDRDGVELGRDGLLINEVAQAFRVRIVEPASGSGVGPVDVRAEVKVPEAARLDRLELYWQDERVASLEEPPFAARLFIPIGKPSGFIRATAFLEDGRVAEDVVVMNSQRFDEELTVQLVELYVVVTDRGGAAVQDLAAEDFEILEDGVRQEVETFAEAGDLPITVGMALDSSLSLFLKMPALRAAATGFVNGLVQHRDRAFLVGFSSRPRIVRATTASLEHVVEGIDSLRPEGTTALWEGVVLSLQQLQEVLGRKALIVFYDGDDEDQDFSYSNALRLAREVGVPVYLIVMNNTAARTNGEGFATRSRAARLERLAAAGGGRVFYVRTDADLGEIFGSILTELRSHYLLTYYPRAPEAGAGAEDAEQRWRPIEVRMRQRGLDARTLAGYDRR